MLRLLSARWSDFLASLAGDLTPLGFTVDRSDGEQVTVTVTQPVTTDDAGGTDGEVGGTVVEDFGDLAGHVVDIGENHIVGPARRWAVALDAGGLVFVDSDQLVAE